MTQNDAVSVFDDAYRTDAQARAARDAEAKRLRASGIRVRSSETMAHTATYNITDDKIKLYPAARLTADEYAACRAAGFAFWPGRKIFAAKWSTAAEDFALTLVDAIDDDDTPDDVEARVNRFREHAEKAEQNAESAEDYAASDHANTARRVSLALSRATNEAERAAHWKSRIAGAVSAAQRKENPGVIARRIKGLEAEERKYTKNMTPAECLRSCHDCIVTLPLEGEIPPGIVGVRTYSFTINGVRQGEPERKGIDKAKLDAHTERQRAHWQRWLDHVQERLQYERALLAAVGGLPTDGKPFEVGGAALIRGDWAEIIRVNRTTFEIAGHYTSGIKWDKTAARDLKTRAEYCAYTGKEDTGEPAKPKTLPILNYPQDSAIEMTSAEWSGIHRDYKGTEEKDGHRVRSVMRGGKLNPVFITDTKATLPPPPPPMPKVSETTDAQFDAMKPGQVLLIA